MSRFKLALVTLAALAGCAAEREAPATAPGRLAASDASAAGGIERLETEHLPNAVRVHPRVISGGLPDGDAGFEELSKLGVKTVISVDGARPDVEAAARHGLRYVHLPHGYDGIPQERARELAKAVRELEGPVYIHCHHGKHRSPAAASVACVTAGLLEPAQALAVLELAGTSRDYQGLYQSAGDARPLEAQLLKQLPVEFRETTPVPPMADAMVQIEHTHDHLRQIAAAGWETPAAHSDLVPAHEALLLQEHFTELRRTDEAQQQPVAFRRLLQESESAALKLTEQLRAAASPPPTEATAAAAGALLDQVTGNCKACHQQFRDAPLHHRPATQ